MSLRLPKLPAFILEDRVAWSIRLVAASLLFIKLFTFGLWQSERIFPLAPAWSWVPRLPAPLDLLMFGAEIGLLGWITIRPARNKWFPAFFVIALVWVLTDQIRLTPWYYLYGLLLVPALLYKVPTRKEDNAALLLLMQVVVIGLYVWSGAHKHSYDYYNYVHGFVIKSLEAHLPESLYQLVDQMGAIGPWFELAAGLFLAFGLTRNLGVFMLTGMHAFLLLCLGPLGSGWNSVIWPWNISMVLIIWVLFYSANPVPWRALFAKRVRLASCVLVLLAIAMPALRFADAWDNNLSFCLYSGKTRGLNFFVRESAAAKLPEEGRKHLKPAKGAEGWLYMSADSWSTDALGVPVNPQDRIYKAVGKALNDRYFAPDDFIIMIKRRPGYVEESDIFRHGDY